MREHGLVVLAFVCSYTARVASTRPPKLCVLLVARCYHQRCYWWQRVASSIECAIEDSQCFQKPQTSTNTWQEHSHLKIHIKWKSFALLLDSGSSLESGINLKSTNPSNLRSRGVLASTCRQVWILFTRAQRKVNAWPTTVRQRKQRCSSLRCRNS